MSVIEDPGLQIQLDAPVERRRPGRMQVVNPLLVPLLRGIDDDLSMRRPTADETEDTNPTAPIALPSEHALEAEYRLAEETGLAPARGIAVGLAVSALFWGILGYFLLR